jgi:hypothetical protein
MVKKITVQGSQRKEPDARLFVLALIEYARQQEKAEQNNQKRADNFTPGIGSRQQMTRDRDRPVHQS